jgi:hypothetical protein
MPFRVIQIAIPSGFLAASGMWIESLLMICEFAIIVNVSFLIDITIVWQEYNQTDYEKKRYCCPMVGPAFNGIPAKC